MGLEYRKLIKSFFPKGKIWDTQQNLDYLIDGVSKETERVHVKGTNFYNEFNIIQSSMYAQEHSLDYLIVQGLYSNIELQRIITFYLNKDYEFKESIEDFANFINSPIEYLEPPLPFTFGSSKFGDFFGSETTLGYMQLFIKFQNDVTCIEYNKIKWLIDFLKPPYLEVIYSDIPVISFTEFTFSKSSFGDRFKETIPCVLIS